MTFSQFIAILHARWKLALSILLGVTLLAVLVSLVMPKRYTATAAVVVNLRPDPISATVVEGLVLPTFMATQIDILKSTSVSRRAAKMLGLSDNPAVRDRWQAETGGRGDFDAWAGQMLQRSLDVKPARESSVINVSYRSGDSKFAASAANAYVQAYSDTVLDLRVDPAKQYTNFFDSRARQLKERMEAAQSRLSEYQKQKGILATDERLDVETARLNELSAQIVALQGITAESGSRMSAAQGRSAESLQDVLTNPLISGLKANLSVQEAKLQELTSRLGDAHPQVIETRANINALRRQISAETARITTGVSVTANINKQRETEIRAAYDQQRQKVLKLKERRDESAGLVREVEDAQKAYESVRERLNQTALESQSTQTNISVLNQATEPADPSSPRILLNTAIGVFLGALLAMITALVMEMMNRRVRSIQDVVLSLGVPVIGVLPKQTRTPLFGKGAQPLLARRVLGQLPLASTRRA
ncbi:MAG TPA: chain length determinant protein EpsF [Burkholderiaceae bacterium]|jgi:chain length determinant protein EpsF|nr:chain length determinant protein EpsF [Burkholderiaceae bacterium]